MGLNYKFWAPEVVEGIDRSMRAAYPDRDTFFVSSAAYDGGLSERTLRNHLYAGDLTLQFIDQLPGGAIATCSRSMQAWGEQRRQTDGRRTLETWKANFRNHITDTSPCSAMIDGPINKANDHRFEVEPETDPSSNFVGANSEFPPD